MHTRSILFAMPLEASGLLARVSIIERCRHGFGEVITGSLGDAPVLIGISGVGKVAAAALTATMIEQYGVNEVTVVGFSGGVALETHVGEVVVATAAMQHDMDASASKLFPRYEVPLTGCKEFPADDGLHGELVVAAKSGAARPPHVGLIASGDQFIGSPEGVAALRAEMPHLLAVDMESAAVAQVCHGYQVPWGAVRVVSDRADDEAHRSFAEFAAGERVPHLTDIAIKLLKGCL